MTTGLDMISNNKPLQEHWLRRVIASIIDSVIIYVIFMMLFSLLFFQYALFGFGYMNVWLSGLVMVIYSGIMEGSSGATIGKKIMKLRVVSLKGELTMEKALIRNISKIFGLLLIIDLLAGLATEGDPRQRYLDRMQETTVVEAGALSEPLIMDRPPAQQYQATPPSDQGPQDQGQP